MRYEKDDLEAALACIKEGGIILYPTDTVWGLGCNAYDEKAIEKLYALKNRPAEKSMIVLVDTEVRLERSFENIPDTAWDLIEYSEEPLTLILDNAKGFPDNLIHEDGSLAVRVVDDLFCQHLISKMRAPLVSTSANLSGGKTPQNFSEIDPEILERVDYVVRFKQNVEKKSKSSKIIKLKSNGSVKIIR
jgi:L-threonylcarbamoyladenylate synthase